MLSHGSAPHIPIAALSLISVLNADLKFSPHLPPEPKGIGRQDTASLPQQGKRRRNKTVKHIYLQAYWREKGEWRRENDDIYPHRLRERHLSFFSFFHSLNKRFIYIYKSCFLTGCSPRTSEYRQQRAWGGRAEKILETVFSGSTCLLCDLKNDKDRVDGWHLLLLLLANSFPHLYFLPHTWSASGAHESVRLSLTNKCPDQPDDIICLCLPNVFHITVT